MEQLTERHAGHGGPAPRPWATRGRPIVAALAVLVLVLVAAGAARAELPPLPGSIHGGEVEVGGRGALTLGMGWPSTYVRYDLATRSTFGIGFRGDFFYGMPLFGFTFGLGTGFSVPMRIQVFERDRWTVAVFLKPQLFFGFGDRWWGYHPRDCYHWWGDAFFLDVGMDAGVRVGFQPRPFLTVYFGGSTPLHILVIVPDHAETEVDVFVPILLTGGIELSLSRTVNFFVQTQVGPALGSYVRCVRCDGDECTRWDRAFHPAFAGRFYAGFTFHF
jgi:hypothetical protein